MPNQAFGAFLQRPAVAKLLADLTQAGRDAAWPRQATSTASIIDVVRGDDVASARLGAALRLSGRADVTEATCASPRDYHPARMPLTPACR